MDLSHVDAREVPQTPTEDTWVPATDATGYIAPFGIHYRVEPGGRYLAMADSDLAYWAEPGRLGTSAAAGLAVALVVILALARWRTTRRVRAEVQASGAPDPS